MHQNTLFRTVFALTLCAIGPLLSAGCNKVKTNYADNRFVVQASLPSPHKNKTQPSAHRTKLASTSKSDCEAISAYGNPSYYHVKGKRYQVISNAKKYDKVGIASWYGKDFNGKLTANQEKFDMYKLTAASKTLPLPTYVKVTNLSNNKSVVVRVNDRGPYVSGRIMDLSYAAAKALGFADKGTTKVHITALSAPNLPDGSHYLQIASFCHAMNARNFRKKIAKLTKQHVRIRHYVKNKSHEYYRVEVGPYSSPEKLHVAQSQFKKKGYGHTIAIIG